MAASKSPKDTIKVPKDVKLKKKKKKKKKKKIKYHGVQNELLQMELDLVTAQKLLFSLTHAVGGEVFKKKKKKKKKKEGQDQDT